MLTQKFNITPQGYITQGSASYAANEETGEISVSEDIFASIFLISKELKADSNAKVDPKMFLSANIQKGVKFAFSTVSGVVTQVGKKEATIQLTISDDVQDIHGYAAVVLDISQPHWSIVSLEGNVQIAVPIIGHITQAIEALPA